jgi:hypothetical protein
MRQWLGLRRLGLCETHDTHRELIGAIHTSSDHRKLGPCARHATIALERKRPPGATSYLSMVSRRSRTGYGPAARAAHRLLGCQVGKLVPDRNA